MVQLVQTCLQSVSQPGVNFLIKHAGSIFRRLFPIALRDVKSGGPLSQQYHMLPQVAEKQMFDQYEELLEWDIMGSKG